MSVVSSQLIPFTAHRFELGHGTVTVEHGEDPLNAFATQVFSQALGGVFAGRRILDVACLEGGFSITFAQLGARDVVGIEGREMSVRRGEFLREHFGIDNVRFMQGDVKHLDPTALGTFDAVFAKGILYHLDDPCPFVQRLSELSSDLVLIDTHVAKPGGRHHLAPDFTTAGFGGRRYRGRVATEVPRRRDSADPGAECTFDEDPWSALSNTTSFWLAEADLVRLLRDVGFGRVYKARTPASYECSDGCPEHCRVILVARKHGTLDDSDLLSEVVD